jgi:hypothetical protein
MNLPPAHIIKVKPFNQEFEAVQVIGYYLNLTACKPDCHVQYIVRTKTQKTYACSLTGWLSYIGNDGTLYSRTEV